MSPRRERFSPRADQIAIVRSHDRHCSQRECWIRISGECPDQSFRSCLKMINKKYHKSKFFKFSCRYLNFKGFSVIRHKSLINKYLIEHKFPYQNLLFKLILQLLIFSLTKIRKKIEKVTYVQMYIKHFLRESVLV